METLLFVCFFVLFCFVYNNFAYIVHGYTNSKMVTQVWTQCYNTFINNSVSVTGGTVSGPSAHGGGVSIGSNSNPNITGNTTFIANSAGVGGGVYVGHKNNVNISGNTTFIG